MRVELFPSLPPRRSFLFVGIHNAWDTVTYHVLMSRHGQGDAARDRGDATEIKEDPH